jgi:hypothetical protein
MASPIATNARFAIWATSSNCSKILQAMTTALTLKGLVIAPQGNLWVSAGKNVIDVLIRDNEQPSPEARVSKSFTLVRMQFTD